MTISDSPTTMDAEPVLDLAHLAHIELLTPDLEGSVAFFTELMGLHITERSGQSAYLACYEERYHHSLKLTRSDRPGLGHAAWRTRSAAALARRVAAIEASGRGRGWIEGEPGHGPAYQFDLPNGQRWEIFWEVDYASAPDGQASGLLNRPFRRPRTGIPVRRLDHFNLTAKDVEGTRDFLVATLGFAEREAVVVDGNGPTVASWLSVTNLSHDMALVPEPGPAAGRLHHACFCAGTNEALFDFADLCREEGVRIEHGPGRHGIGKATFLYVFEPGGNRIEMLGDPGALVFDPSWATVRWPASQLPVAAVWTGTELPGSFWEYATPPDAPYLAEAVGAA